MGSRRDGAGPENPVHSARRGILRSSGLFVEAERHLRGAHGALSGTRRSTCLPSTREAVCVGRMQKLRSFGNLRKGDTPQETASTWRPGASRWPPASPAGGGGWCRPASPGCRPRPSRVRDPTPCQCAEGCPGRMAWGRCSPLAARTCKGSRPRLRWRSRTAAGCVRPGCGTGPTRSVRASFGWS